MSRIRQNFLGPGELAEAVTDADTTLKSPMFVDMVEVTDATLALTLDSQEIVHVTAHTADSDEVTVVRGQEDTTASAHDAGTRVEHAPTAHDIDPRGGKSIQVAEDRLELVNDSDGHPQSSERAMWLYGFRPGDSQPAYRRLPKGVGWGPRFTRAANWTAVEFEADFNEEVWGQAVLPPEWDTFDIDLIVSQLEAFGDRDQRWRAEWRESRLTSVTGGDDDSNDITISGIGFAEAVEQTFFTGVSVPASGAMMFGASFRGAHADSDSEKALLLGIQLRRNTGSGVDKVILTTAELFVPQ